MNPAYTIQDTSSIYTPALIFYKDLIRQNIQRCLDIAGSADRLRPHCKTHKTREIARLLLDVGVTKQKCATLAEAEMLAECGVPDVLLAYNLVGPNTRRLAQLLQKYPHCRFGTLVDHPDGARALSAAMQAAGQTVGVLIDMDVGQHRTGIAPGADAVQLYTMLAELPGLTPRGIHVYDGHNHQSNLAERESAVRRQLEAVLAFRAEVEKKGLPAPLFVAGGTPTFPIFARLDIAGLECSPGTCILHDHGYGSRFLDMTGFVPAAVLLSRVISKPTPVRLTLDLGYKAIASDPPAGKRLILLNVPEYEAVLQNEEHLVIETDTADQFPIGAEIYAVPTHICPTCALHQQAYVVEQGRLVETWPIVGRDRLLTV